jgi:hypothetical protein
VSLHVTDRFGSRCVIALGTGAITSISDYLPSYKTHTDVKASRPSKHQPSTRAAPVTMAKASRPSRDLSSARAVSRVIKKPSRAFGTLPSGIQRRPSAALEDASSKSDKASSSRRLQTGVGARQSVQTRSPLPNKRRRTGEDGHVFQSEEI